MAKGWIPKRGLFCLCLLLFTIVIMDGLVSNSGTCYTPFEYIVFYECLYGKVRLPLHAIDLFALLEVQVSALASKSLQFTDNPPGAFTSDFASETLYLVLLRGFEVQLGR